MLPGNQRNKSGPVSFYFPFPTFRGVEDPVNLHDGQPPALAACFPLLATPSAVRSMRSGGRLKLTDFTPENSRWLWCVLSSTERSNSDCTKVFWTFSPWLLRKIYLNKLIKKYFFVNKTRLTVFSLSFFFSGKIVSPKWKSFRGLRLLWRDKIRLNNGIWRAWYIQCECSFFKQCPTCWAQVLQLCDKLEFKFPVSRLACEYAHVNTNK